MCSTRHASFSGGLEAMRPSAVALRRLQAKLYAERLQGPVQNGNKTSPRFLTPSKSYPGIMHRVLENGSKKLAVHNKVNGSEHRPLRVLVPFLRSK